MIGSLDELESTRALREAFARALQEFQEKRFDAAESSFRSVLEIKPDDGPAKFYLHQIEDMRRETLPADWKGEVELKDK